MEPTNAIGERLREIRINLNLSLDETAKLTGVSKPMLGQIERGQSVPTITTLWKIATGLKKPLSSFLDNRQTEYDIVNIYDASPITEDNGRMRAYTMFPYDPIRSMEMFFIEFDSECRHASDKHSDGVEEYIMVLSGKLQLVINGEEVVIEKDNAIRLRADVPHEYNNPFSETCTVYNIIYYPK
ncbi:MAG: XRE family transcriptional regulator [Ruminococcus sp.]|nr:XRE family transcriptional regulator [Ruminococcus sp.]